MPDTDLDHSNLVNIVSSVAVLSTICLFLTGFEICWRIKKRNSTEGIGSAPFHMGFLSGLLWLHYGVLKHDVAIMYCNSVSSCLYSCYLTYYLMKTPYPAKRRQLRLAISEVVFIILVHGYIRYSTDPYDVVLSRLGSICVVLNISTVGAPLMALEEVIRSRSTENLPLPLCFANLLVTTEWLFYGYLVNDIFIKVPNSVALLMSIAQIVPFAVYPRSRKATVVRIH